MISAKLMNELRKQGITLISPGYDSNNDRIRDILKENDERLSTAIPLFLKEEFDYHKTCKGLDVSQKKNFNRIMLIAEKIFRLEGVEKPYLKEIIRENKIKQRITKEDLDYYHASFKEAIKNQESEEEEKLKSQIKLKESINIKKALSTIYSPAKIRIMEKIFNHEKLTNTELKYYYRSIRPLTKAILNKDMQDYLNSIENTKKYAEDQKKK